MTYLNYNKFRIWVGRILGLTLLIFANKQFNLYGSLVMVFGIMIRLWASGYIHKDKEVTTAGPYKLLRHPLYLGNFLAGLGFALLINVWQLVLLYIPIFLIVYYKKMRLEETYLLGNFGSKYRAYQKTTPLFIPNLAKLIKRDTNRVRFSWQCVFMNREHLNLLGSVLIMIILFYLIDSQFHSRVFSFLKIIQHS